MVAIYSPVLGSRDQSCLNPFGFSSVLSVDTTVASPLLLIFDELVFWDNFQSRCSMLIFAYTNKQSTQTNQQTRTIGWRDALRQECFNCPEAIIVSDFYILIECNFGEGGVTGGERKKRRVVHSKILASIRVH